jgi:hypothetical protein
MSRSHLHVKHNSYMHAPSSPYICAITQSFLVHLYIIVVLLLIPQSSTETPSALPASSIQPVNPQFIALFPMIQPIIYSQFSWVNAPHAPHIISKNLIKKNLVVSSIVSSSFSLSSLLGFIFKILKGSQELFSKYSYVQLTQIHSKCDPNLIWNLSLNLMK